MYLILRHEYFWIKLLAANQPNLKVGMKRELHLSFSPYFEVYSSEMTSEKI